MSNFNGKCYCHFATPLGLYILMRYDLRSLENVKGRNNSILINFIKNTNKCTNTRINTRIVVTKTDSPFCILNINKCKHKCNLSCSRMTGMTVYFQIVLFYVTSTC